jgi:hypothetical protein
MKFLILLSLTSSLGLAETWSGALVDASCYAREERNVTLRSVEVNHDRTFEIHQCEPNAKTKAFSVVQEDGQAFKLDAGGDAKAAHLIAGMPKKGRVEVQVTGEKSKETVTVRSISQLH